MGLADGLSNADPKLTESEIAETIQALQAQMLAKREEMQKEAQQEYDLQAKANAEEGCRIFKG